MSKVLKVGGMTPSGVATGLRLTNNGTLPIYSPQKDFFVGSVVEPVPHGHVGARGVFGLKCRGRVPLTRAYSGGLTTLVLTNYGVVISGMDRLQAFDGNLNALWDISLKSNRTFFTRSIMEEGVIVGSGWAGSGLRLSEVNRHGKIVNTKELDELPGPSWGSFLAFGDHYFLFANTSNGTELWKLDAGLNTVWREEYIGGHARSLLVHEGLLHLITFLHSTTHPGVRVVDPDYGAVLKEWVGAPSLNGGVFVDGYMYCTSTDNKLYRINTSAADGESFEKVADTAFNDQSRKLQTTDDGAFVFISGGDSYAKDRRLYKADLQGNTIFEIKLKDWRGENFHEVIAHNDSLIVVSYNELLVLSSDLQFKGYTLS